MLNSVHFTFSLFKILPSQLCSATAIAYKGSLAHLQRSRRLLTIFSLHMRRNGYLGASGENVDLAIRFGDFDFL